MTCTQNHKTPEECLTSDCVRIGKIAKQLLDHHIAVAEIWKKREKSAQKIACDCPWHKETYTKNRMTPDETFIQWLKIIGLSIGLGLMIYQTYLLKIISEK